MLKSSFVFLHLAVVGISVLGVSCFTAEEELVLAEALKSVIVDCMENCGITEDDLKLEKNDNGNPCVKKCILIKGGVLDEEGKYKTGIVKEQILKYTDNKEEADKFQDLIDKCLKGKEDDLKNDKDAEMKRVDIIFNCLKNYKP